MLAFFYQHQPDPSWVMYLHFWVLKCPGPNKSNPNLVWDDRSFAPSGWKMRLEKSYRLGESLFQKWIGLRENLQENPIFNGNIYGFL